MNSESFTNLPGSKIVTKGLTDISCLHITKEALLVLIAGPSLRRLGIAVSETFPVERPYEHALYTLIEQTRENDSHSYYNSLIRMVVSFTRALESELSKNRAQALGDYSGSQES